MRTVCSRAVQSDSLFEVAGSGAGCETPCRIPPLNYLAVGRKNYHRKRDMRVAVQVSQISSVQHFYPFSTNTICFLTVDMIATYFTLT